MKSVLSALVLLLLIFAYLFVDFNKLYLSLSPKSELILQKNCDLHKGPCSIIIANGEVLSLEIFPKDIPLMKTLHFKVHSSNQSLDKMHLKIYSRNMFMGSFDFVLKNTGKGYYETKGIIPTCMVGKMQWNADLEILDKNKLIGARYQFNTE